jgi:sarcosine dehydrogenase
LAAPECANMYVGAGFNAFGIASGGGAGWVLADWVMAGEAPMDLWVVDIRRFSGLHRDRDWVCERTCEAYGKHYTVAFPHEEYGKRPAAHRLAVVRPAESAPRGLRLEAGLGTAELVRAGRDAAARRYSMGRQNWFGPVGEEQALVARAAGFFDQSSFAKYEVSGVGREGALDWICANHVTKEPGGLPIRRCSTRAAGSSADLTVARLAGRPVLHRHRHRFPNP